MLTIMMKADNIDRNRGPCGDWYIDGLSVVVRRRKDRVPDRNLGDLDCLQTIGSPTNYKKIPEHTRGYKRSTSYMSAIPYRS